MTAGHSQQTAIGSYIAQASHGSTAISAQQLVLVLEGEISHEAKVDLVRHLAEAVSDLSRTVVVDREGNLIGEGYRYVPVQNTTLRSALASMALQGPSVPLQLPIDVIDFTNRSAELDQLDQLVCDNPGTACVYGMGGVGKSSFVTRFAHMRQQAFTDGILWGDLRHQDTASILDMFAYSYDVDLSSVTDLRAKTNVVKSLLAARRSLVILDNAEHAPHLELLLAIAGRSSVIVTTRNADTPELRGKPHLRIETFTEDVALEHFARILGHQMDPDQQRQAARLAALLGYLPLGLDIGIRLAKRSRMDLASFSELLTQSSSSSILIDESRSLRSCFNVSWNMLAEPQRQLLYSMTILNGPSTDVTALAAINHQRINYIRYMMGELAAGSLVIMTQTGRYLLHPLVRDFISDQLTTVSQENIMMMGERAVSHYLSIAEGDVVSPEADSHRWDRTREELENELAAWRWAHANHQTPALLRIAASLGPFLFQRGYWDLCMELLAQGIQAAIELHDKPREIRLRLLRGELAREQGSYRQATQDLEICMAEGQFLDAVGRARVVREMGELRRVQREYGEALRLHRQSLQISVDARDLQGQARSLHDCGLVERITGNYDSAEELFLASMTISRQIDADILESYSKLERGITARTVGRYDAARGFLSEALEFFDDAYDLRGQSYTHRELGELSTSLGAYEDAARHYGESLRLNKTLSNKRGEAISGYYLAYALHRLGRTDEALSLYEECLLVSQELSDRRNIARLRLRLGELRFDQGDVTGAREHWNSAVALFEAIGVAETEVTVAREHLRETATE